MYLICIFSPFIGSALSGLFGRFFGFRGSWLLTTIFMAFSFFCSLIIGYEVIVQGCAVSIDLGYWFSAGSVSARWGFHIDTLTVCMFFTVTLVSLCVHIYSFDYMNTDPHLPRFMSYLSLFTGFMLVLVSADNMLQMLVGWEGIGLCSFLLIGFWYHRLSATKSAVKAMLVNRISDTFLFISIMLMWWYLGSTDYSIFLFNTKEAYYLDWICLTMMLGAAGKSAQIGLHVWLANAMEGPTPVSALIHAATLVTAGVYIIARTNYLWECSEISRTCLTVLGALTCIMAATCGFFQNDMKKVIAYSTCSQLGYQQQNKHHIKTFKQKTYYFDNFILNNLDARAEEISQGIHNRYKPLVFFNQKLFFSSLIEKDIIPNKYYKLFENISKNNIYIIKKQFQNLPCVYLWVNKLNGKCYVGSCISLNKRLEHYFSNSYLKRVAKKMPIVNAILLHNIINFKLYI